MTPDSKAAMEKMLDYRSHFDRESRLCLELGWLAAAEFYEGIYPQPEEKAALEKAIDILRRVPCTLDEQSQTCAAVEQIRIAMKSPPVMIMNGGIAIQNESMVTLAAEVRGCHKFTGDQAILVIEKSHHDAVVAELKAEITRLEQRIAHLPKA